MKRDKEIKGNILIYCLFQISNICLSVLGFFTFGISIYIMVLSKSINFISIIFFFFGVILIILAYYGCKMRNAPIGNLIYSVILTIIFVLDMISTIVLLVDSNVVTNIMSAYDVSDLKTRNDIQKFIIINMKIVDDLLLIILSVLFCVVIFSWWYRKSLLENQAEWNRSLIDDNVIEDFKKRRSRELRKIN